MLLVTECGAAAKLGTSGGRRVHPDAGLATLVGERAVAKEDVIVRPSTPPADERDQLDAMVVPLDALLARHELAASVPVKPWAPATLPAEGVPG